MSPEIAQLKEITSIGLETAEVLGFCNEEELQEALIPLMQEVDIA